MNLRMDHYRKDSFICVPARVYKLQNRPQTNPFERMIPYCRGREAGLDKGADSASRDRLAAPTRYTLCTPSIPTRWTAGVTLFAAVFGRDGVNTRC